MTPCLVVGRLPAARTGPDAAEGHGVLPHLTFLKSHDYAQFATRRVSGHPRAESRSEPRTLTGRARGDGHHCRRLSLVAVRPIVAGLVTDDPDPFLSPAQ